MIAIIDYNAGNLDSVYKAIAHVGKNAVVTSSKVKIKAADKLILPGVGNFKAGICVLRQKKLDALLTKEILKGKPFLGICLGMQLLFDESEEARGEKGLGLFKGVVTRFKGAGLIVPHMGWNSVRTPARGPKKSLWKSIDNNSFFYFAHSYYCPRGAFTEGVTDYGIPFSSYIHRENVYAVQFHPEKSQKKGLTFLRNFCDLKV